MESKILSSVIGFVIGDAMGVPVEFVTRKELIDNPVTEMLGYGSHPVPAGTWSDDTSMSLALMDSIINVKKIDYDDIMIRFTKWVNNGEYTTDGNLFDIGRTCLRAIRNYTKEIKPIECGLNDMNYNGNGSLMRILPLVHYCYYKKLSDKEIIELTNNISSLTHAHEVSRLGCYIYVGYAMLLLDGKSKEEAYQYIKTIDYSSYSESSIDIYKRILKNNICEYELDDISSSGYVVDTLEVSIWVLLNTNSYEESIIKAINLGNDTDTIGAIVGSMAGIIYGYSSIPERWLNKLIKFDYLKDMSNRFEEVVYELL